MNRPAHRLLIAGTNSGCGKTTVVCAILQALKNRGLDVGSCKCGPDYIDPMFHREVIGLPSRNIDLFFSPEEEARRDFAASAREYTVIEGVMGFYDGLSMTSEDASSYTVAQTLSAPAVLIVNARGMALSAAAAVKGFLTLRTPNPIRGVLLNGVTEMSYPLLKEAVEKETGVPVYGYLPRSAEYALESRHLGLITAQEITDLRERLGKLAEQAERSIDLDGLLRLMESASELEYEPRPVKKLGDVTVAVASDRAFCFYYPANLELLEALGARLVPFSPLTDQSLPECDGLLLGGGYPELYAGELAENVSMRRSVKAAVEGGLPTVAECGGFMYLMRSLGGAEQVGVFDTACENTGRLRRFGYVTLRAESESLLFAPGDTIRAHEFHYWDADRPGDALLAEKPGGRSWRCAYVGDTVYAGYPHLYFPSGRRAAERFIEKCIERRNRRETDGDRKTQL